MLSAIALSMLSELKSRLIVRVEVLVRIESKLSGGAF
jgi:hypothetical protein